MDNTIVIGIMGGIGCGKSTVAAEFARLGCAVIDADELAHGVLGETEVVAALVERFGSDVLGSGGGIDRSALGRVVFDNAEGLAFLNSLVHPRVLVKCEQLMADYVNDRAVTAVVLDMPLLLEVGWEKKCDFLVFVDCEEQKRLQRAGKNGKIDPAQLKKREKCQISLDKKRHIAHYIIHNNSDISDVREQVAHIFSSFSSK